jgi:hypothetical protein
VRRRQVVLAVGLCTAAGALPSSAWSQQTLTGEALFCSPGSQPVSDPVFNDPRVGCSRDAPPTITDRICEGLENSYRYDVAGFAVGPFPGTFRETGTVMQVDVPGGVGVVTIEASFTIQTAAGTVTGRKRGLQPSTPDSICVFGEQNFTSARRTDLCYVARLPGGGVDRGGSDLIISRDPLNSPFRSVGNRFGESFFSDPASSCAIEPETKQECKNGGWQIFGVFKNQGDCVSFVATGGRNPPAGAKKP